MGTFRHLVEIAATETGSFAQVKAIVDTGATYGMFLRPLIAQLAGC